MGSLVKEDSCKKTPATSTHLMRRHFVQTTTLPPPPLPSPLPLPLPSLSSPPVPSPQKKRPPLQAHIFKKAPTNTHPVVPYWKTPSTTTHLTSRHLLQEDSYKHVPPASTHPQKDTSHKQTLPQTDTPISGHSCKWTCTICGLLHSVLLAWISLMSFDLFTGGR